MLRSHRPVATGMPVLAPVLALAGCGFSDDKGKAAATPGASSLTGAPIKLMTLTANGGSYIPVLEKS